MLISSSPDTQEIGLCPHGRLPGICKDCLATEDGLAEQAEIRETARGSGSKIAKALWERLESEKEKYARDYEEYRVEKENNPKAREPIGPPADPVEYIYDVAMILGAGFRGSEVKNGIDLKARDGLNMEFRMRLNAAAQLYFEGRARIICLTGGPGISEEWQDFGALSEVAKQYLIEKFNIPESDIILENQSDATHSNLAFGMREMYKDNIPVGKFAIISTNYHLNRAREMAKRSGITASFLPAESLLLKRSRHYRKFVENWLEKAQNAGMEENEVAKLMDPDYWQRRAALFETPLDREVPKVDISADVAATASRLAKAGAGEDIQTGAF